MVKENSKYEYASGGQNIFLESKNIDFKWTTVTKENHQKREGSKISICSKVIIKILLNLGPARIPGFFVVFFYTTLAVINILILFLF